jgi:hypothetical protein
LCAEHLPRLCILYHLVRAAGLENATAVVDEHPHWIHFKAQALVEMRSLGETEVTDGGKDYPGAPQRPEHLIRYSNGIGLFVKLFPATVCRAFENNRVPAS